MCEFEVSDFPISHAFRLGYAPRRSLPGRQLVVVGDSSFAAVDLLAAPPRHETTMAGRLRLDAALYEPAPPRSPDALGRPRKKGKRLPKLEERLTDPKTRRYSVEASWWPGPEEKALDIATGTAVWYTAGKPVAPPVGGARARSRRGAASGLDGLQIAPSPNR